MIPGELTLKKEEPIYIAANKWGVFRLFLLLSIPFIGLKFWGNEENLIRLANAFVPLCVFLAFISYWMASRMAIIISNSGIAFKAVFKTSYLQWHEIKSARIAYKFDSGTEIKWVLQPYKGKPLTFRPNFFSNKSLMLIAGFILKHCTQCAISEGIKEVSAGKYPWSDFKA